MGKSAGTGAVQSETVNLVADSKATVGEWREARNWQRRYLGGWEDDDWASPRPNVPAQKVIRETRPLG